MNKYLMRIRKYFSGWKEFEIEAKNKEDAVVKATEFCKNHSEYGHGGNYDLNSIECMRKLKK